MKLVKHKTMGWGWQYPEGGGTYYGEFSRLAVATIRNSLRRILARPYCFMTGHNWQSGFGCYDCSNCKKRI